MRLVVFVVAVACALVVSLGLAGGDTRQAPPEKARFEPRAAKRPHNVLLRDSRPIGRSVAGRRIEVKRFGGATARRKVLIVGCIHGTECAGIKVARMTPSGCPLPYADLRIVENLNPDGYRRGSRLNARGVDLNRNFSAGWRPIGRRGDLQYSGARPFSEPETRAARRLIESYRPDVTVWFHQQAEPLVRAWGPSVPVARRYARMAGLPFRRLPWMAGTAPNWQNNTFPGTASFVVELPPGRLPLRDATRHASAIERIGGYLGQNSFALGLQPRLRLARAPYVGVACRTPNSTACDRVGLAVFLPEGKPAERLQARINGRTVRMRTPPGHPSRGTYFEGYLRRARFDGRLPGSTGEPAVAKVQITALYADGRWAQAFRRVRLAAGWG